MTTWTTRDWRRLTPDQMENGHLLNTHRMLVERLLHVPMGVNDRDRMELAIEDMAAEIAERGLTPHEPRSRELSESVQGVSALRTWWPHMGEQDKREALRSVASFLRNVVKTDEARTAADYLESEPAR